MSVWSSVILSRPVFSCAAVFRCLVRLKVWQVSTSAPRDAVSDLPVFSSRPGYFSLGFFFFHLFLRGNLSSSVNRVRRIRFLLPRVAVVSGVSSSFEFDISFVLRSETRVDRVRWISREKLPVRSSRTGNIIISVTQIFSNHRNIRWSRRKSSIIYRIFFDNRREIVIFEYPVYTTIVSNMSPGYTVRGTYSILLDL